MIVVHVEYQYARAAEDAMRSLVPDVERYSRGFEGCESFTLSFPVDRPGILLGTEVWADAASLRMVCDTNGPATSTRPCGPPVVCPKAC